MNDTVVCWAVVPSFPVTVTVYFPAGVPPEGAFEFPEEALLPPPQPGATKINANNIRHMSVPPLRFAGMPKRNTPAKRAPADIPNHFPGPWAEEAIDLPNTWAAVVETVRVVVPVVVDALIVDEAGLNEQPICAVLEEATQVKLMVPL